MSAPFGQPSYAELVQQLADLRDQIAQPITLDDLPLKDLRSQLIENGEPLDLSVLALTSPLTLVSAVPAFVARRTADLAFNSGAFSGVAFTTLDVNTDNMIASGNDTFTCRTAGLYVVVASVAVDMPNSTGTKLLALMKNNLAPNTSEAGEIARTQVPANVAGNFVGLTVAAVVPLIVADTVSCYVWQGSGVTNNVKAIGTMPQFAAVRVSA